MIFNENKIYLMGILNITPDSFSDGGKFNSLDRALFRVEEMIKEGADVIDIGGESTRPFSESLSLEKELDRVIPVIEKVTKDFDIPVSIDTYKSKVADEALKNGAKIINDISGFMFDNEMEKVALKHNATSIIMHIKGTPKDMQSNPIYEDVVTEVYDFLNERVNHLKEKGLKEIIIDVGFGFGKSLDDNYLLLKNLIKFKNIGCPILSGISRKSMIGKIVDVPASERVSGSVALNTIAILNGTKIIRCH
ncbi:MAG TPA: dihydropteroate synthase, partial [Spirochaetota bacterium]|nr:dihydropteroate synthase [Spirochaetota bacterium]